MSSMYGSRGMPAYSSQGMTSPSASMGGEKIPSGYQKGSTANYTPEMMQLFQQMMQNIGPESYTGRLAQGDESLFSEMEAPALRQFSGLQGNIASRFSGMGTGGRRSSGFQNTMNQAGSDFAQDLQSRRQELMRQAIKDMHGMSSDLLDKKPYENYLMPKKKSFLEELFGNLSSGLGQGLGMLPGLMG